MPISNRFAQVVGAVAAIIVFAVPSAYAQNGVSERSNVNTAATRSSTTGVTTGSAKGANSGVSITKDDQRRMKDIAEANIAEIDAGKLALSKSQNSQVRSFAQKLIDDHTKALKELQNLAQKKGVTLPTETDTLHKTIATLLKALRGNTFNSQFISHVGVGDHQRTHNLLQDIIDNASDPDLKAYAQKTLPIIDQHMNMAQRLENSMKSKGGSSSSQSNQ